ncbi:MAG: hypothetical protein K940chlam9_00914 [Chlamydiae bacterium]|nr:hypothetical protein [Chlamydiota bacterium]
MPKKFKTIFLFLFILVFNQAYPLHRDYCNWTFAKHPVTISREFSTAFKNNSQSKVYS